MKQGEHGGEVLVIRLCEWQTQESFAERLDALIGAGLIRIAIDLHGVALVNSTMLGLFVRTRNEVRRRGGDFALVRPSPFVCKTLESLGLDTVLQVAPDAGAAVESFWSRQG
jgi:anti-anti-sigma factor